MKRTILCLTILCLACVPVCAREPKEYDSNVIYDENRIPTYDLPPLLVTAEGTPVTTAQQWRTVRRPQILSLFSNFIYGRVPEPESPINVEFKVLKTDPDFIAAKKTIHPIIYFLWGHSSRPKPTKGAVS